MQLLGDSSGCHLCAGRWMFSLMNDSYLKAGFVRAKNHKRWVWRRFRAIQLNKDFAE